MVNKEFFFLPNTHAYKPTVPFHNDFWKEPLFKVYSCQFSPQVSRTHTRTHALSVSRPSVDQAAYIWYNLAVIECSLTVSRSSFIAPVVSCSGASHLRRGWCEHGKLLQFFSCRMRKRFSCRWVGRKPTKKKGSETQKSWLKISFYQLLSWKLQDPFRTLAVKAVM